MRAQTRRCDRAGRKSRWLSSRSVRPVVLACFAFGFLCFPTHAQTTTNYADNAFGDAGFDGLSAVITNGHGPKRYIGDAITTASDGGQINVAAGTYQESLWNPGTKSVTLLPQGQVTIVDYDPGQTNSVGDGIPDWWRIKYFGGNGTTTNNLSCASCDPNSNGVANLQEYIFKADPLYSCPMPLVYTAD